MATNSEKTKVSFIKTINLFFLLFLLFGMGVFAVLIFFYKLQFKSIEDSLKTQEINAIKFQRMEITESLSDIVSDLLFISTQNELQAYFNSENQNTVAAIEEEYKQFSIRKKRYGQIRYLDNSGQEIVRVNYNSGTPFAVTREALQNKSKRYYFSNTFRLKQEEIFISPLDLNIEHGEIERPLKPVLRFGTPVFDAEGDKRGIVLINYLAQNILDLLKMNSTVSKGDPMLLNRNGFWLLHSDPEKEWGFMFKEREKVNFANIYPKEWQEITKQKEGQFYTKKGLFTFATIYPLQNGFSTNTDLHNTKQADAEEIAPSQHYWIVVSYISPEKLKEYTAPLQTGIFFLSIGLFIFVASATWFLASAIVKRRIYQENLLTMALHDNLTSLPNRKYFLDKLEKGIAHARRYGNNLGLLYIDLDGFKSVNDTFGHKSGDELLVEISKRMLAVTRETDTVARLGGDEFAVILFQVDSMAGILTTGEKLIKEINKPVILRRGTVNVGGSIGAAIYPGTVQEPEELVNLADKAMYIAKSKGKNRCIHL